MVVSAEFTASESRGRIDSFTAFSVRIKAQGLIRRAADKWRPINWGAMPISNSKERSDE